MGSRAPALYEQLTKSADQIAFIEDMVRARRAESAFLEFKSLGKEQHQKEHWSLALSGFGNTEGGVIIWGVKTSRVVSTDGQRKIDVASSMEPIDHPATLAQFLRDVELEAVVERIQGVEISFWARADGKGYVVYYIPEGTHKPYRAELEPQRQYWQRIGDKFVIFTHSLLRSLFYPRSSSDIQSYSQILWTAAAG